ncbi:MAG: helix-turn-helix domain-containing protein [Candidatus Omnitrophica bacterium]|nr:helix-turn-helix domain-containing protein [Candidatus Omnitrophota bacterium]
MHTVKEYISLEEAGAMLSLSPDAVKELISQGELTAYRIAGQFLRCKKDEIEAYRRFREARLKQIRRESDGLVPPRFRKTQKRNLLEVVADFFYFNDFYIAATALIVGLLYWIIKLQF